MNIEEMKCATLPRHIAIIMDGNGRWAEQRNLPRYMGHKEGIEAVRRTLEASVELHLEYLTLYAFSIENWNRPKEEVDALMEIFVDAIEHERDLIMRQKVRLRAIGNISALPEHVLRKLNNLIDDTSDNTGVCLVLALSYGARWEIVKAAQQIAQQYKSGAIKEIDAIDEHLFAQNLNTVGIPDPDLLIRTSGECRLSNFLLWQSAYTEFYFIDKFWPDFQKDDLYLAIHCYQNRERRFGKTSSQLKQ